jgi:hypothetical protein
MQCMRPLVGQPSEQKSNKFIVAFFYEPPQQIPKTTQPAKFIVTIQNGLFSRQKIDKNKTIRCH